MQNVTRIPRWATRVTLSVVGMSNVTSAFNSATRVTFNMSRGRAASRHGLVVGVGETVQCEPFQY